nr:MAG TPA: endopeptidase tail [Bacteriophage sp.]
MYQLKYKNYILYDPRLADEKLIVRDPSVKLAVSKAGEMSFTVDAEHPYLSNLRRMSGLVELLDGTFPIYRGRITSDIKDFYGAHKIETEGIMAVLNDSIIPPFNFPGDFKDDAAYKAAAASGNVVEFFFRWILSQHNAQVTAEQQIKPGVVTVSDPNNYIARSSEEYATAMTTISDKLFKSSLGGNLLIRYEDDGNYLDYYAALPLTNTQTVKFAENLLDLSSETDGADIYTAILPEGKDGLTIGNLPDGDLTDDLVKSGKTIYSKSGVATYGRITRHIKWGDVTVDTNLRAKAKAALADNGLSMPETITCRAVDLGWREGIQHFRVGRMTALVSTPHGYSASYPLMELAPDILDPGNTQITLGATRRTFTGSQIDAVRKAEESTWQVRTDLNKKIEDIELTPGPPGPAGADGKDGTNGTNGLSVWITYHDETTAPATPTGNGTQNGWHTDLTAAVVWMSQKVAASATAGVWGVPIRILGQDGQQGEKGDPGKNGTDGKDGAAGVSVTNTDVEYYLSTSATELSGGTWQATAPTITDGTYLWSRTKITYSNGQTAYTGAYCISKAMTESAEPIVSETRTAVTKLTQDVDSFKATVSETYTEKSNFDVFRQKTESDLTANSTAIEQRYTEIKTVEQQVLGVDGKVTDVQKKVTETAGYIRTGKVAEDESGNPIYGVKIGQTDTAGNYNAFAQFTAGRISFFDEAGKEISHFAGADFFVDSGIIVQNLNLGGYELRRNKGLGFKWIGG